MKNKSKPIILEVFNENNELIRNYLYTVIGKNLEDFVVFKQIVVAENINEAAKRAMFKANKERSYYNRLKRTDLRFSIKTIKSELGRKSVLRSEYFHA